MTGDAPEPYISISDDTIVIRRSWEGHHNGRVLAWFLDVDEYELSYHNDGIYGWFTIHRDRVDLEWLAQRIKELFLQVQVRCHHDGICPVHNIDTRWREPDSREAFNF